MSQHLEVKVTWEQHKVPLRPGLTQVADGKRALGTDGLEATHMIHTSGFWICKGILTHLNEDDLGGSLPQRLIFHWER